MEVYGYLASFVIGLSLGIIGGGGSILTVPVMVYLFGIQPLAATSYSLFVVGSTSLVGAIQNLKRGLVQVKTALLFGTSSIVSVLITRKFLVPHIPSKILSIGSFVMSANLMTMILFAILMIFASLSMLKGRAESAASNSTHNNIDLFKLLLYGAGIGIVTGLLGAGGGFLLIPALVIFVGLPMKEAVGTSLFIISLNSLIGFAGDIHGSVMNWKLLFSVTSIAIAGVVTGSLIGKKIPAVKLKKAFAWFVMAMGVYILSKELLLPLLRNH